MDENSYTIEQIIQEESIVMMFQPLISTFKNSVIGLEALVRGIIPQSDQLISPAKLFQEAREHQVTYALDLLCLRKAIKAFHTIYRTHQDLFLFLNIDHSTIVHEDFELNTLMGWLRAYGIKPESMILEISELEAENIQSIHEFAMQCKQHGIMVCLDDVGAGHANLDRIALIKPDIIKIDKELVIHISKNYYKQQVVEMIIKLAKKVGAVIVAEGVENIDDILTILEYGEQLLQGYYISKPIPISEEVFQAFVKTTNTIRYRHKHYINDRLKLQKEKYAYIHKVLMQSLNELEHSDIYSFKGILKRIIGKYADVESAYILDERGIQITDTECNQGVDKVNWNIIYNPFKKGADLSLQSYYYQLVKTGQKTCVSDEYISMATGNKCVTISSNFGASNRRNYFICLDFSLEFINQSIG